MKNRITRNLSLKILSLLIGIVVWLLVVNLDNPVITKNFILQDVELVNEAYIDATGKVALKTGEQTSIRVTVKGARKTVGRLSVADIKATADLQQAVNLDTKPVMIPISVTVTGIVSSNISVWPQNISVTLEDKVSNEFIVAVNNGESKPGSGYEVGTQTVSPEKLRVTGPRSLMNKIDKVNVNNNLGGTTSDQTTTGTVVVIDKNGVSHSFDYTAKKKIPYDGGVRLYEQTPPQSVPTPTANP
jgi:YbbR domain-containing protein